MVEQALEKLERECAAGQYDRYAQIMKDDVLAALKSFCRQNEEFAQAVVQGGSFTDCMKAVAKNCGSGISDQMAYGRAVEFYFPTAAVRFEMVIDLTPHDTEEREEKGRRAVVLNLADFLM